MNKSIRIFALSAVLSAGAASAALAQSAPVQSAPAPVVKTTLAENDRYIVTQVTAQPGAEMPWHSHKAHIIYALTDVNFAIEEEGKAPSDLTLKKGQSQIEPPVRHRARNPTDKVIVMIVTEEK